MKFFRESRMPPGTGMKIRNTRLYGSPDEQIEGYAERARGCPDPESAVIYRKRRRARPVQNAPREVAQTPAAHKRHVEIAEHNMIVAQAAVQRARADGKPTAELAAHARELRAKWLDITGGLERREVEVDQGSAVNPMVAV